MKKCKDNRGFSLVELIIVIAIMAILVGVLVPTYLRYVEKSRISSDSQLIDSVCQAVTFAATDPKILEDSASQALVDSIADASSSTATTLDSLNGTTEFAKEVMDTLGWSNLTRSTYEPLLKSRHDAGSSTIYIQRQGSINTPYMVWVSHTDKSGRGNLQPASDMTTVGDCICVK